MACSRQYMLIIWLPMYLMSILHKSWGWKQAVRNGIWHRNWRGICQPQPKIFKVSSKILEGEGKREGGRRRLCWLQPTFNSPKRKLVWTKEEEERKQVRLLLGDSKRVSGVCWWRVATVDQRILNPNFNGSLIRYLMVLYDTINLHNFCQIVVPYRSNFTT